MGQRSSNLVGSASKAMCRLGLPFESRSEATRDGELAEPVYRGVIAFLASIARGRDWAWVEVHSSWTRGSPGFDSLAQISRNARRGAVDIQTGCAGDNLRSTRLLWGAKGAPRSKFEGGHVRRWCRIASSPNSVCLLSAVFVCSKNPRHIVCRQDVIPAAKVITPSLVSSRWRVQRYGYCTCAA